jgi:hypothetical protein
MGGSKFGIQLALPFLNGRKKIKWKDVERCGKKWNGLYRI